jgi:hypothetical protein
MKQATSASFVLCGNNLNYFTAMVILVARNENEAMVTRFRISFAF